MITNRPRLSLTVLLVLWVIAWHFPGLGGEPLDRDRALLDDARIVGPRPAAEAFVRPFPEGALDARYRPLTLLSLRLDHAVGGGAAWPFRLTSLVLLVAGAGLVYRLARRLRLLRTPAALGAALWAAHPAQAECVSSVAGRCLLLSFVLAAAGAWLGLGRRGSRWRSAGAAALLLAAGLAMKASLVFILFVALVTRLPGSPVRRPWRRLRLLAAAAVLVLAAEWIVAGSWHAAEGVRAYPGLGAGERALLAVRHIGLEYPRALVDPSRIGGRAPSLVAMWSGPGLLLAFLVLAAVQIGGVALHGRGESVAAVALLWWPLGLLPFSHLVQSLATTAASRHLVFALVAPALLLASALEHRSRRTVAAAAAALFGLGLFTAFTAASWRTDERLARHRLWWSPGHPEVCLALGRRGAAEGENPDAAHRAEAAWLDRALAEHPDEPALLLRRAEIAAAPAGAPAAALRLLDRLAALAPRHRGRLRVRAEATRRLGRPLEALELFEAARAADPTDVASRRALAEVAVRRRRLDRAEVLEREIQHACVRPSRHAELAASVERMRALVEGGAMTRAELRARVTWALSWVVRGSDDASRIESAALPNIR